MKKLMKYIPKQYKNEVENIQYGEKEFNEDTHRWNQLIVVTWKDGEETIFQNVSFMREKLKEFGRDWINNESTDSNIEGIKHEKIWI